MMVICFLIHIITVLYIELLFTFQMLICVHHTDKSKQMFRVRMREWHRLMNWWLYLFNWTQAMLIFFHDLDHIAQCTCSSLFFVLMYVSRFCDHSAWCVEYPGAWYFYYLLLLFLIRIGLPIYRGGFPRYNSLDNILNPRPSLPLSAITRDPFWYDLGDVGLRPFGAHIPSNDLPSYLRESYLSPIKRRYLWTKHPIRPFGKFIFMLSSQSNFY